MEIKRRGFLGGVLAAFATTPEKVLKASGIAESQLGYGSGVPSVLNHGRSAGAETPWFVNRRIKLVALKTLRPWWFEQKLRAEAKHVNLLDVDVASYRSVSPAAKIAIMRERVYRRAIDVEVSYLDSIAAEEAFTP